ncbi:MAG TPA: hypothetical protein DDW24_13840, partial [Blastocatellia bacterium]|nr:hypothetical protein [Blastocatellia bacterium]
MEGKMRRLFRIVPISILLVGLVTLSFGQTSTGTISGTVSDQAGAVVAGATVSIKNAETGFARTATSGSDGRFSFTNIPTGPYELTVEAGNFAKLVQTGIQLVVNQNAVVNPSLKPGGVEEVVTVTENAS